MHSISYDYAPPSFSGTCQTLAQRTPELNLRNVTDYCIDYLPIELFKKRPIYSFPNTWNSHDTICYYPNRTTFNQCCGSVYYWLFWIRIRIRILYTDPDPDPAAEKLTTNLNILNIL